VSRGIGKVIEKLGYERRATVKIVPDGVSDV